MKPEIKAKWLEALRSGEYVQGHGRLVTYADGDPSSPTYCCLGVLCELAADEGIVSRGVCTEYLGDESGPGYLGKDREGFEEYSHNTLPTDVVKWAGTPSYNPIIRQTRHMLTLAEHNDGQSGVRPPKSFTEIADLIEEYL